MTYIRFGHWPSPGAVSIRSPSGPGTYRRRALLCLSAVVSAMLGAGEASAQQPAAASASADGGGSSQGTASAGAVVASAGQQSAVETVPATLPAMGKPSGIHLLDPVPGGLTAEEAGQRAARTSREVFRLQEEERVRGRDAERVIWQSIPRINFSARYARLSEVEVGDLGGGGEGGLVGTSVLEPRLLGPGDPLFAIGQLGFPQPLLNNYSLTAGVTVPLSSYIFQLKDTLAGTHLTPEIARLEANVARQKAAVGARLDYYTWAQAKLNVLVAKRGSEQARERLEDLRRLLRSGRIAQADVLQAEAFAATAELTAEQARTQAMLTERRLRIAVHAAPGEKLVLGQDVLSAPAPAAHVDDPYRHAVEHRLEVAVINQALKLSGLQASVAKAGGLPKLEAFADFAYSNPNPRVFPQQDEFQGTWQVGLQVSFSPSDYAVAGLDADEENSRAVTLRSQLREVQDSLQLEVLSATRGLTEARLNIQTSQQVQHAASAAYEARATLFRHGRATSFEILQAETERINADFQLVGAYIALQVAQVRLDQALGRAMF